MIMPDAAQYTLNLFDAAAPGWTLPAPEPDQTSADNAADPEPDKAPPPSPTERGTNFSLTGDR